MQGKFVQVAEPAPGAADVSLRGHHFLCTLHYRGAGYSAHFTDNFTSLCEDARARDTSTVEVAEFADGICSACPSLQADEQSCEYQASIMRRDGALLTAMGWQPGQVMSLEQAHWDVLARREELMKVVCPGCEWLPRCQEKGPYGLMSPLTRTAGQAHRGGEGGTVGDARTAGEPRTADEPHAASQKGA
jgi:hypothetical protein